MTPADLAVRAALAAARSVMQEAMDAADASWTDDGECGPRARAAAGAAAHLAAVMHDDVLRHRLARALARLAAEDAAAARWVPL